MPQRARTITPPIALRIFVADLVDKFGLPDAAAALGLSKLATLNLANGGQCIRRTVQRATHARDSLKEVA